MSQSTTDVCVVGGGPAGLAVAIAARQRGFSVLVADGAQPPIDKACGEGFLPDGLAALDRLGIHLPAAEGHVFRGVRFLSAGQCAAASFTPPSYGLSIRRTYLHRVLIERAEQLGARLAWRTPVRGISREGVHIGRNIVVSRWIVGADGANSRVRRWSRLDRGPKARLRYTFRRHFRLAPWTDYMEVYWGAHCQGYATGVGPDTVCVALASDNPALRLEDGLRQLPALNDRLRDAEVVSTERGALTGNRRFRQIWRGNVALVGDASGTVDAITGEGLGLAFNQALALIASLESGKLASYQREHRKLLLRPSWMARLMLTLDRRPNLQRRTVRVFREHPEIFRRLVEFHVGTLPSLQLVKPGLTLGWGLLTT